MELQLVQEFVPLPNDATRRHVLNAFNRVDYERNVELLKRWLEDETHAVCDEIYVNLINTFLRGAKNDYARAKKRLRNYFLNKERDKFPEWYQFYDLQAKFTQFQNFYCLCQPGTTAEGYRISCVGFTSSSMDNFDIDLVFQTLFMIDHLGVCLGNQYFLGCITIIDCKNVTSKHALKILSWTFRRYAKFQNDIMPYRIIRVYLINVPKYIDKFVLIGKAFMSEKLRKRFCVEQSDREMRRQVPKEFLPADYGGSGKCIQQQIEHWFRLLMALRPWYEAESKVCLRADKTVTDLSETGVTSMREEEAEPLIVDDNPTKANSPRNRCNREKLPKTRIQFEGAGNGETEALKFCFNQLEID